MNRYSLGLITCLALVGLTAADDVTPNILTTGRWVLRDEGVVMGTLSVYTFDRNGSFKLEELRDVETKPVVGKWKLVAGNGTARLVLTATGRDGKPDEKVYSVRHDQAKDILFWTAKGSDVERVLRHSRR